MRVICMHVIEESKSSGISAKYVDPALCCFRYMRIAADVTAVCRWALEGNPVPTVEEEATPIRRQVPLGPLLGSVAPVLRR